MTIHIKSFFDQTTSTFTYPLSDASSGHCIIIDPVLNYDPKSGRTSTQSADEVVAFVNDQQLNTEWILETHAHADHLTAAHYLKAKLGGKIAIGERIPQVQKVFQGVFNLGDRFKTDGSQFDCLLKDNDIIPFGDSSLQCLFVPGHTPACVAYHIDNAIFVGDTLFMPDVGTARCDFPGGDAHQLYQSIKKLLNHPPDTKLYLCHDYPPNGRVAQCETTIEQQTSNNIHIHDGISEEAFVLMRTARDKTLEMPALMLPAIQVNIRAGELPAAEANGTAYLKIPLNVL